MATNDPSHLCRLCFDAGGTLIAPCLCKGTSRWIHRSCLDRWRSSGTNAAAVSRCVECGFNYHVQRVFTNSALRDTLRKLATQTLAVCLCVQVIIIAVAIVLRLCDSKEMLVAYVNLPMEPDQVEATDVWHALRFHVGTYYIASVYVVALIVGVPMTGCILFEMYKDFRVNGVMCLCRSSWCIFCLCPFSCPAGSTIISTLLVCSIFFTSVGFCVMFVSIIAALQYCVKEVAVTYERDYIVREFEVVDLASLEDRSVPTDTVAEAPQPPSPTQEQETLQREISDALMSVYGPRYLEEARSPSRESSRGDTPRGDVPGYGSV
eukprot:TRINITY_DN20737_c0_g1_i1.p1 TRINITY_DN20737_c0_g1~~TRINITY_DN20737_c0_g1_i1.p1  ORF type:complete len:321 (+),score=40.27 TRINITY_DN20737_c0_g1_i1:152-1114(+)